MATLKNLLEFSIQEGMKEDPRGEKEVKERLKKLKDQYNELPKKQKKLFNSEQLSNPYMDTRIIYSTGKENIKTVMVGIDAETQELLLVDRLNEKGKKIDAILTHHPEGRGLASLYQVMDINIDTLIQAGVPPNQAEAVLAERIQQVKRGIHPLNVTRTEDAAKFLGIPIASMHTVADNHVHTFLKNLLEKKKPKTLQDILDILLELPEYQWAQEREIGPFIVNGTPESRTGKIAFDMTGGTDPDEKRIEKIAIAGISTIVGMHINEKQIEEIKKHNINVVNAGHMSSDSVGMNLLLDKMEKKFGLKIIDFSGFKRVKR